MVAKLGRRGPVQEPGSVLATAYGTGAREFSHRRGHRWAMRADEIGQALVGQGQWHSDPIGADAAEAVRKMPQRQQEAILHAWMMGDGKRHAEKVGSPGPASEQLKPQRWPWVDPADKAVVEHSQSSGLQHHPTHLGANMRSLRIPTPRTKHIPVSEHLDASAIEHLDLPCQQSADDQEPTMVDVRLKGPQSIPFADRERVDGG